MVQCRIGWPQRSATGTSKNTAKDLVPAGPALQERPGKLLPRYWVFSKGISPPSGKAGLVTVRRAPSLGGNSCSALGRGDWDCAKAEWVAMGAAASVKGASAVIIAFMGDPFLEDAPGECDRLWPAREAARKALCVPAR